MLRSSAQAAGYAVDVAALVDAHRDPGVPGGREIIGLAQAVAGAATDAGPIHLLSEVVGAGVAVEIAGAAANFEIMNRVVDGVGLPFGKGRIAQMRGDLEVLGMTDWLHAP